MRFIEAPLSGAYIIEPERLEDERGYFARAWCARELEERGLCSVWVQSSISYNRHEGTLRGMHYQEEPYAEAKLVTCTSGSIYDVIVDLRTDSTDAVRWFGTKLDAADDTLLYVPAGFAHGFITLEPDTVVQYHMSEYFEPEAARGFRFDDPAFGISWQRQPAVVSERDAHWPDHRGRS